MEKKIYCQICSDDLFNTEGELEDNGKLAKYRVQIVNMDSELISNCPVCEDCFKDESVNVQTIYNS